jgi:hypothetical protein
MATKAGRALWIRALPWVVGLGALLSLAPLAGWLPAEFTVAHTPTFLVLLGFAVASARKASRGERVSVLGAAAVLGATTTATAGMLSPIVLAWLEPSQWWLLVYPRTWIVLPFFAILGAGLVAAPVALRRLVCASRKPAR